MPETWPERSVFLVGLLVVATMLFFATQRHRGSLTAHADSAQAQGSLAAGSATQPGEPTRSAYAGVARNATSPLGTKAPSRLVVTAARGDSWLSARADSAAGRQLYEGTLKQGEAIRLAAPRIWIRFGAAANLDLALNGRRLADVPVGTLDVVVTPAGLKPA